MTTFPCRSEYSPLPLWGIPPLGGGKWAKNAMWWHIGPLREGAGGKADWGSTAWTTNSRKQRCAPPLGHQSRPSRAGCLSPDGPVHPLRHCLRRKTRGKRR